MYTSMNACRAYLYSVARAVDNGHVSPKVNKQYLHDTIMSTEN
jgi:hypothetical protein